MKTALIIIDMQMLMEERIASGRDCVNPDAPRQIEMLAAAFRKEGKLVVHVRHADSDPASPLHPDASGYETMPCAREIGDERVFVKKSSSAFATTALADYLHDNDIYNVVVTGAVLGFCVNSTVRAGSDLGFKMTVVQDAVLGFDLPSAGLSARQISDVTIGLLESDFAEIVGTETAARI